MNTPKSITLINGALTMDGGSVYLEAVDDQAQRREIQLIWSISAQKARTTHLVLDGVPIAKQSEQERELIALIAAAETKAKPNNRPPGSKISSQRIVLADDADAILKAGEHDPAAGLAALRDSLLMKIRSSTHE